MNLLYVFTSTYFGRFDFMYKLLLIPKKKSLSLIYR